MDLVCVYSQSSIWQTKPRSALSSADEAAEVFSKFGSAVATNRACLPLTWPAGSEEGTKQRASERMRLADPLT